MDTIEAIHTRRSIRDYAARPVPRGLIEDILFDTAQTPVPPVSKDAPFHFAAATGADRIAAMGRTAHDYARAHRPSPEGFGWVERAGFLVFFNAPAVIVLSGWRPGGQALEDVHRAGQTLMLSAHVRGLGTCWVGAPMLWLTSTEGRAAFGVPDAYDPVAAFTIGYAAGPAAGRPRGRPEVFWNGG